jgi:pimeloyl-ACP methyl ester carboxylesterase
MAKATMNDLVVLLPGIIGSVLQRGGEDVWNVSGGAIRSALYTRGRSLRELKLGQDDITKPTAPDGVVATSLIHVPHLVAGLFKVDGYTTLADRLTDEFELEECSLDDGTAGNFLRFAYDWRRDVRASAGRLKAVIDKKLPAWEQGNGTSGSRVILVAHSMGGLVAQYYLEKLGGWASARALITFATPYRGAVQAIEYLLHGYKLARVDLTEAMRSFPSVYQLLPRYDVVATGGGLKRVSEIAAELKLDPELMKAHVELHRELDEAAGRNRTNAEYKAGGYITIPIVGTRQPTLLSATWDGTAMRTSERLPDSMPQAWDGGDGTVPRVSAVPLTQAKQEDFRGYYVAEQHASVQNHSFVLDDLIERLKQLQAGDTSAVRGELAPGLPRPLSLRADDSYAMDQPVLVHARAAEAAPAEEPKLVARAEPTEGAGGPARSVPMTPGPDGWQAADLGGLVPGLYRLRVAGAGDDAPRYLPVHTLLEIVVPEAS